MGLSFDEHMRLMYFYGPLFMLYIFLLVIWGMLGGRFLLWLENLCFPASDQSVQPQSNPTAEISEPDDMYLRI